MTTNRKMSIPKRIVSWLKKLFSGSPDDTKIFVSLLQPVLTFITAGAAITSLYFSVSAFRDQRKSLQIQRQSDMTFRFQQRWQQVEIEIKARLEKGEIKIDRYLYLYWGIQYDQYVMHKYDNLLPELFDTWMAFRKMEYDRDTIRYIEHDGKDTVEKYITYKEGFERTVPVYGDPHFMKFFQDTVFKGKYIPHSSYLNH